MHSGRLSLAVALIALASGRYAEGRPPAGGLFMLDRAGVQPSVSALQLEFACRFYGLDFTRLPVAEHSVKGFDSALRAIAPGDLPRRTRPAGGSANGGGSAAAQRSEAADQAAGGGDARSDRSALAIDAGVLHLIDRDLLLAGLRRAGIRRVLIAGAGPSLPDPDPLPAWTGGTIAGRGAEIGSDPPGDTRLLLKVLCRSDLGFELSGETLPFPAGEMEETLSFLSIRPGSELLCAVLPQDRPGGGGQGFPAFARFRDPGGDVEVFVASHLGRADMQQWRYRPGRFVELVPALLFLRSTFGERCWHAPSHFANLCIDDPPLTSGYGNLRYGDLLREMQKANFHTTIAFIPWNYERSDAGVVGLFRENPGRFSICMHGNNHDHEEFLPARSRDLDEANIRQALARMEEFRRRTGLPYDRLMVFPHRIAAEPAIGLLRRYRFLATVNADNVPQNSRPEAYPPLHPLREDLLSVDDLLSLRRVPADIPRSDIARKLFLDVPLLFYTHQDFFASGIDAFNGTAGTVNAICPDIRWEGPGAIAADYHLEKAEDDGTVSVWMFGQTLRLQNPSGREVTYLIRSYGTPARAGRQALVGGTAREFEGRGDDLVLKLRLAGHDSSRIALLAEGDGATSAEGGGQDADFLLPGRTNIGRNDLRVTFLRTLSEFRDRRISTTGLGRSFERFYYAAGASLPGALPLAVLALASGAGLAFLAATVRRRTGRRRYGNEADRCASSSIRR